eukprot:10579918-Lingulodinium_polyedra.AAC.1
MSKQGLLARLVFATQDDGIVETRPPTAAALASNAGASHLARGSTATVEQERENDVYEALGTARRCRAKRA